MIQVTSPLRYPGSKQRVMKLIRPYWDKVKHNTYEYREPFLGGASIFLNLTTQGKKVWLNDKDSNIATLFSVIRDQPDELCSMIEDVQPTIELWEKIRFSSPEDDIEIAFRTLFLNRTNYSGILSAAPIGGFRQESEYPIHCRWNGQELIKRIKLCSTELKDVRITSDDFMFPIVAPSRGNVFLMIDPPYYIKGNQLYDEGMTIEDHIRLRDLLATTKHRFLLTYDNCPEIRNLYGNMPGVHFFNTGWAYSAGTVQSKEKRKQGKELFITNIEEISESLDGMQFEQVTLS
ncbi:DNA adenine methylase [Paenibacillus validus]|uniref:DNA adenine methylase n=1 Tax=Paenibacillus validus TaxID=44253 RepID=UPI000FDA1727|nr:DNA adenine methylase [Paenibacillus validus]MED4599669.1 DNA adenine methylase [Paenibacillus validus]MED4604567.1 DNA adenine methylase [Paenibacillus validus]